MGKVYQFIERSPFPSLVGTKMLSPKMDDLRGVQFLHPDQVDAASAISASPATRGYPVDRAGMPSAVLWESKNKPVPDVHMSRGVNIVSERVRDVIETREPDVHQFLPVELLRPKADKPFANHYWMIVCRRIDSLHPILTTYTRDANGAWNVLGGGHFVFDLSVIGSGQMWRDPSIGVGYTLCSEALALALSAMNPTGLELLPFDAAPR